MSGLLRESCQKKKECRRRMEQRKLLRNAMVSPAYQLQLDPTGSSAALLPHTVLCALRQRTCLLYFSCSSQSGLPGGDGVRCNLPFQMVPSGQEQFSGEGGSCELSATAVPCSWGTGVLAQKKGCGRGTTGVHYKGQCCDRSA